jgi:PAS domain S-box-containing protein
MGVSPDTYQGWRESEVGISPKQTEEWRRQFEESLNQGVPIRFQFKTANDDWFAVTVCAVVDPAAKRQQFCYLAENISEWKNNAEQSLVDRERLTTSLLAARLGIWDWSVITGTCHYGGSWGDILGYPPEYFKPKLSTWEDLVHPDDLGYVLAALERNLAGESAQYDVEYRLKTSAGNWLWVLARGRVVERDRDRRALRHVGVVEDIHERKTVRDQLKLEHRRKDEFIATLAHELRNPLAPIGTGLEIIKRDPTGDAAKQARDMMERQLSHLVRLIDDLLDISRISLGRLELKKSRITLKSIIDTAIEGSTPFFEANKQVLHTYIPAETITLMGDLTRLSQIVSNLLNNAAKYTAAGGVISLKAATEDSKVNIEVSDNGAGIPAEMLEGIFDMFGQVDQTLDRAQGGLGIGLALVRKLVELHNGSVKAESPGPGKGSTFRVTLPIEESALSEAVAQPPLAPSSGNQAALRKILIVDDNVDAAVSLQMLLQIEGQNAQMAHSGREALEVFKTFHPDLVFLDIGLPDMNGFEVAKQIRLSPGGATPCLVALTGWGSEKDKIQAKEVGFNGHMTKPAALNLIHKFIETGSASDSD